MIVGTTLVACFVLAWRAEGVENDSGSDPFVDPSPTSAGTSSPTDADGGPTTSEAPASAGTDSSDTTSPDPSAQAASGANGDLAGTLLVPLFSQRDSDRYPSGTVVGLDLASGRYAELPGSSSLDSNGLRGRTRVALQLERDVSRAGGMIGTVTDCLPQVGDQVCVLFMDGTARNDAAFVLGGRFFGRAKRSRDGRLVAIADKQTGRLELRSPSGDLVSDAPIDTARVNSAYDWLPDGRLLVAANDRGMTPSLTKTAPYSARPETTLTLPDGFEGKIEAVSVSPSGDRAVLTIAGEDDTNDALEYRRPVVLEFASNAVYEPIAIEPGESMDAQSVIWSPDGRWLLFVRSFSVLPQALGGTLSQVDSPIYAVRADGQRHVLPPSPDASTADARMIVMRPLDDEHGPLEPGNYPDTFDIWAE